MEQESVPSRDKSANVPSEDRFGVMEYLTV